MTHDPMHPAQEPPPRMSGASRPGAKRPRFRLPARGASRVQPLSQVSHVSHAWDRQDGTPSSMIWSVRRFGYDASCGTPLKH